MNIIPSGTDLVLPGRQNAAARVVPGRWRRWASRRSIARWCVRQRGRTLERITGAVTIIYSRKGPPWASRGLHPLLPTSTTRIIVHKHHHSPPPAHLNVRQQSVPTVLRSICLYGAGGGAAGAWNGKRTSGTTRRMFSKELKKRHLNLFCHSSHSSSWCVFVFEWGFDF